MLLLTRRSNESIFIDDMVRITVLRIQGNQIHLGIKAPRDIPIHQEEIYRRIQS